MSELQRDIYRAIVTSDEVQQVLAAEEKCVCGSRRKSKHCCRKVSVDRVQCSACDVRVCHVVVTSQDLRAKNLKQLTFVFMHLLLKTSNHVALLLPSSQHSPRQHDVARRLCQQVFERHQQFVEQTQLAAFQTLSSESLH